MEVAVDFRVAKQNVVSGIVVVCIAVAAFALTFGMPGDAVIFPRIASSILFALGVLLVATNVKKEASAPKTKEKAVGLSELKNPALAVLIIGFYVLGIRFLGFYASTVIVLPVFMRFLGIRSAKTIVLITVVVSAIIYLVFSVQLGVLLPTGILY